MSAPVTSPHTTAQQWVAVAREVASHHLSPHAAAVDATRQFPSAGVQALMDSGLLGLMVPREFGGLGEGILTCVQVLEELAAGCASTAAIYLFHSQVVRRMLDVGTENQKQRYLPLLAASSLGASSWTEPGAGADKSGLSTTARRCTDGYRITGRKTLCTGAGHASLYTVLVRIPPTQNGPAAPDAVKSDQTFLLIPKTTPGLSFGEEWDGMGLRGTATGELICDDCFVPAEDRIGPEGSGPWLMALNRRSALHPGVIGLGIGRTALHHAVQSAREGGLGRHQALRFMVADAEMRLSAARALVYEAATLADQGAPTAGAASLRAKVVAAEAAVAVADTALQLFGGRGYRREVGAERHYRDARALSLMGPTSELCRDMLGQYWLGMADVL